MAAAASEESTTASCSRDMLGLASDSDSDLQHGMSDPDHSLEAALTEELLQLVLNEAEAGNADEGELGDAGVESSGEGDEPDVHVVAVVAASYGEVEGEWDGWGVNEKSDDDGVEEEEKKETALGGGGGGSRDLYPVRPEAEDCAYFMKTGMCKYGSSCRFNHPLRRRMHAFKDNVKGKDELLEQLGQTECKYYSRMGGCKFGKACRYSHPTEAPELNFLGLPIRPGEKECPYYMRTGSCKYASNCRYNHPDPTDSGGGNIPAGFRSETSALMQRPTQPAAVAPWSPPGTLKESSPFVPPIYPPPIRGIPSQSAEWNNKYRAPPAYSPERNTLPQPPLNFLAKSPFGFGSNTYTTIDLKQMTVDEFPERPGQPDCGFYLKTGDCKFKSNCRYNHPRSRVPHVPAPVPLSDKGLPMRPGLNICSYYSRYGICKFGPGCRFDHPMNWTPSNLSAPFGSFGGPRMIGMSNSSSAI